MVKAKMPRNKASKAIKAGKAKDRASGPPEKPLPVTLLSGFLGSGKTTLLQHILHSDHGLRIAVVVNDIGAINVDANLIKQSVSKTEEKVIALQNGCICCTLRGDLLEEMVRLAERHTFDYIIIESSGISEPEQVAETFDGRLAQQMDLMSAADDASMDEGLRETLKKLIKAGGLEKYASLDTTVTVIDAFTIFNDFDTEDLLSSRRDDVVPEDERTVSDLMVDQIEFADVIILNKTDMVDEKTKQSVLSLIKNLNHQAEIVEASYGKIDVKKIVNTGLFSLEKAKLGAGWLQDLHEMTRREINGKSVFTPKPETEEYNIRNFIYQRQRPFHPRRLFEFIYDKFILQMEHEEDEENESEDEKEDAVMEDAPSPNSKASPSTAVTTPDMDAKDADADEDEEDPLEIPDKQVALKNKREHPVLARLFRSKGEFWLASRPNQCGEWSQSGAMLTIGSGRTWFCLLDESEYLTGVPDIDKAMRHDLEKGGEWGDRRQEIVFIGENLDKKALGDLLDECLLTDEEFEDMKKIMYRKDMSDEDKQDELMEMFPDGFPDWHGDDDHDHDHGHDHEHDNENDDEDGDSDDDSKMEES